MFGLTESIGIDLGTSNMRVYVQGRGILLREPSVVAVSGDEVLCVGEEAAAMLGRTGDAIEVVRPVDDGAIANYSITRLLLSYLIESVCGRRRLFKPRVCLSVPSGATAVEKRAVVDVARSAGAGRALPVEEPVAAGVGAGLEVTSPRGHLIVDVGGGTTDAAVVSLAGIAVSESIRLGGSEMDAMIVRHLRERHSLIVGERTAEDVKIKIGSAYPLLEETTLEVTGRDVVSGLPRTIEVNSEEIRDALSGPAAAIAECVRRVLVRTPPELAADTMELGITMTGGGALLSGLDRLVEDQTELRVRVAEEPLTCVVVGTGLYLDMAPSLPDGLLATASDASSGYSR
jgi:rod shape-determining protein MreB